MIGWEETTLGEIANYWTGKVDSNSLNKNNFISAENMLPDRGGLVKSSYVPIKGKVNSFSENDILISNIRPYFKKIWFADKEGGCSNDVLVFRAISGKVDPLFLYYYLSQQDYFDFMMAGSNGVKMPRGNKKLIPSYRILLPHPKIQKQIASILYSYDNLIANNTRRIKLLEELAHNTYEEWFLRYRVAGQQLEINSQTGLPHNWAKKKNHEICDFLNGFAYYTKGYSESGYTVIDLGNVSMSSDLQITGKEKFIDKGLYNQTPKFHLRKFDVVIAMTDVTSELGILAKTAIIDEDNKYVLNQRVGCLRPKTDIVDYSFLYALLNDIRFISRMKSVSKGAVQFYFNTKDIVDYEHIIPDTDVIQKFIKVYKPLLQQRMNLKFYNRLLNESRDIILPRLMRGKIEIQAIEHELESSSKALVSI